MPYKQAHWFIAALLALSILAFWPGYFSTLGSEPLAFHVHGVGATAWIMLLVFQSYSIHQRMNKQHRLAGQSMMVLVPLFLVGSALVIQTMARATLSGSDPFYAVNGAGLVAYDCVSTLSFGYMVYQGIRQRRNSQLHSRYLLATAFLLVGPVFTRILSDYPDYLPYLAISSPQEFSKFARSVHVSTIIGIAFALVLHFRSTKFGRPWLIAAGVMAAQSVLFEVLGGSSVWRGALGWLAGLPVLFVALVGLLAGAVIYRLAWAAGGMRQKPAGQKNVERPTPA